MPASNIFQKYAEGQQMAQQRELNDLRQQQGFMQLDQARQKALFDDARVVNSFLKSGQPEQALNTLSNRLGMIEQLGGDPSDTMEVANYIAQGDITGAINLLDSVEQAGIAGGFLDSKESQIEKVQSSKIYDDGTVLQVTDTGKRVVTSPSGQVLFGDDAKKAISAANKKVQDRKIEIKRLDQEIKRSQSKESLLTDQQKTIQKNNIDRFNLLKSSAIGRDGALAKAIKFRDAIKSGKAFTGANRRAAQFIPGVWTSQGEFDEEFNAFAEVAARQTLKASGETRPTDADVQGMKQAMFGIGRDEDVNVQLLDDFISTQIAENDEMKKLAEIARSGDLTKFIYEPNTTKVKRTEAEILSQYGIKQ